MPFSLHTFFTLSKTSMSISAVPRRLFLSFFFTFIMLRYVILVKTKEIFGKYFSAFYIYLNNSEKMGMTYVKVPCEHCGKKVKRYVGHVNRARKQGNRLFCSRRCFGLFWRSGKTKAEKKSEKAVYDK